METHPRRLPCVPLTSSAAANAATMDVSITKTAYVPATASASTADTVKFTNNDDAAHQVAFKATSGVACSPTPFTLQPGQSGTARSARRGAMASAIRRQRRSRAR